MTKQLPNPFDPTDEGRFEFDAVAFVQALEEALVIETELMALRGLRTSKSAQLDAIEDLRRLAS
jgi:hypothetical protein